MLGTLTPSNPLEALFQSNVHSVGTFINTTGSASAVAMFIRPLTSAFEPVPTFLLLEALAAQGEAEAFAREVAQAEQTAWTAAHYARAIRLALRAGAHRPATELARRARERYPQDADVRWLADLLAPLPGPVKRGPADPTLRANRDWYVQHAAQYRGQWVAVKNGELLGAAPTLRELKALVGDTRSATLSKVV